MQGKLLVIGLGLGAWLSESFRPLPTLAETRDRQRASDVLVLARDGAPLDTLRANYKERRLAWTPLGEVSVAFKEALIEAEDRRFAGHPGVDVWALGHAASAIVRGRAPRGASTITMQLAGILRGDRRGGRRTLSAKLLQMRAALALEARWTKAEILEAYVNLVGFRGELQGVRAASRILFGKDPGALDWSEGALLAVMIAQPNAQDSLVQNRACRTLTRLGHAERCRSLGPLLALSHTRDEQAFGPELAKHAARRWLSEAQGGVLRTTLDSRLQRVAVQEIQAQLGDLKARNVRDAAVLVLDNASGETLAYVGSSPATSASPEVDGVRARRQAGSILKPFLYEEAFARRLLTPATQLDDSPLEIPVGTGIYRPRNYDKTFRGPVTAREALASSLNVPAVQVLGLVGVEPYWERLKDLGFRVAERADFFGPSLALGAVDVSLEELVQAYRQLALRSVSEPAAAAVASVLSDRVARSGTFGLENYLSTRFYSAVKTGTSKDMRDNWCVGFSERYTVGVWVGNFGGEPMWNVSGVSGSAPIWMKLMRHLHRTTPSEAPAALAAISSAEGATERIDDPEVLARITYPPDGMVVAWDPDLSAARQAILPEVWPREANATLELDGRPWPTGKPLFLAELPPGKHAWTLKGPGGKVLDQAVVVFSGTTKQRLGAKIR